MRFAAFLIVFGMWWSVGRCQSVGIGQWKSYLPFDKGVSVTQSTETVYLAGESVLLMVDKAERSVQKFDKVNGLSDVGIQIIKYNRLMGQLLIAYKNGNLDFINAEGQVINLNALKRNTIFNDKTIHHVTFSDSSAFLACNFGVLELDLKKYEVKKTLPFTDAGKVFSTAVWQGNLYAATESGIYEGDLTTNLADFSNWYHHEYAEGLTDNYAARCLEIFENQLYGSVDDTLKRYDGNAWQSFQVQEWNGNGFDTLPVFHNPAFDIHSLETSYNADQLLITRRGKTGNPATITALGQTRDYYVFYNPEIFPRVSHTVIDQSNHWWIADEFFGGHIFETGTYTSITLNAPYNKNTAHVAVDDAGKVWIAAGTVLASPAYTAVGSFDGVYLLKDGFWQRYSSPTNPDDLDGVRDLIKVVPNPLTGKVYLASFNRGVIEFDNETIHVYNQGTSLQTDALDPTVYKISGMAVDNEGYLWVSNYGADRPISVLRPDGTWKSFSTPAGYDRLTEVLVDFNGYKWFATSPANGMLVFDEGNLDTDGDERFFIYTKSNSELPTNDVKSLVMDLDGAVWVGTAEGTMLFECGSNLFEGDCRGRRVAVVADDFGDYLLKTQNITALLIDGANRKWFGTQTGIYVQSEDGKEEVYIFNEENSPLPSNNITALTMNRSTGEVFIGTDQGMVSFRTEAIDGFSTHPQGGYAYPNPVAPDYDGLITMVGLVNEAVVKITDINGTLVYETKALGGQAVWDGRDYNGRKAASGVYLVFSATRDGLDSAVVTKILLLN